jgi:hypothetical protein
MCLPLYSVSHYYQISSVELFRPEFEFPSIVIPVKHPEVLLEEEENEEAEEEPEFKTTPSPLSVQLRAEVAVEHMQQNNEESREEEGKSNVGLGSFNFLFLIYPLH